MQLKNFAGELKCYRCSECNGRGCPGRLPGLGGVFESKNFQLNCDSWKNLRKDIISKGREEELSAISVKAENLRCGPVTGAVENIGFSNEGDFYLPYLKGTFDAGAGLCIGDGCPDEKLKFGIQAVKDLNTQGAFFFKPYPQERLFERIEWAKSNASFMGLDIDSYNIVTMRNLVNLEKKTAVQLKEFRERIKVPFVIKGIFTEEDVELVKQVKPDVVYISNHGGRVETRIGSTGEFLVQYGAELKNYCGEIWIDGGIRCKDDVQTAMYYGAAQVIVARPFIRSVFDFGAEGLTSLIKEKFL